MRVYVGSKDYRVGLGFDMRGDRACIYCSESDIVSNYAIGKGKQVQRLRDNKSSNVSKLPGYRALVKQIVVFVMHHLHNNHNICHSSSCDTLPSDGSTYHYV